MEDWQKDIISRNIGKLQSNTECNISLLAQLHEYINDEDKQEILAISSEEKIKRAGLFYEKIKLKENSFDPLIAALRHSNVKYFKPARILEEGKTAWEQRNRDQGDGGTNPEPLQLPQQASSSRAVVGLTEDKVIDFIKKKTPLRVKVTRPNKKIKMSGEDGNGKSYKLPVREKGLALVVNITEFDDETKNRPGATKDKTYMTDLWTALGYRLRVHEGKIDAKKLENIILEFRREVEVEKPESIVVFIGSHGKHGYVITSEGDMAHVHSKIVYKFNSQACVALNGKPKIFLISACQTFPNTEYRTKTDEICAPPMQDTMLVLSSTPGYLSKTDDHLGGWFTYCFTKVVMDHAHDTEFREMLDEVQKMMTNIDGKSPDGFGQVCCPCPIGLFKKLYFSLDP